ncbi:MAG: hypothetical protein MUP86_02285, partial [Dehalococcoidia bacterium]|nr:hypothetical protein [Dehalococcoidia bacterium]
MNQTCCEQLLALNARPELRCQATLRTTLSLRSEGVFTLLAAIPSGYGRRASLPAITSGGMSSYRQALISMVASADGALGRGLSGTAELILEGQAVGGLIVALVGLSTMVVDGRGSVV